MDFQAPPHETPPHNLATSRNGVRKLRSETATGLSQREYQRSEYSRDEVAGEWGGKSPGGGWHYVGYILNIPGSVVLTILGARKGSQGRRHTTRGKR